MSLTISFILLFQLLPTNFIPQTQAAGIDENTVLMLHNDGDASETNKTVTVNGDPDLTTGKLDFGDAMSFDGAGDYLTVPDSDDWDLGS